MLSLQIPKFNGMEFQIFPIFPCHTMVMAMLAILFAVNRTVADMAYYPTKVNSKLMKADKKADKHKWEKVWNLGSSLLGKWWYLEGNLGIWREIVPF